MAKDVKIPEVPPEDMIYSDGEMANALWFQAAVYALDDAIENQNQLHRPEAFIKPLQQMRAIYANQLMVLTSRGDNKKPEEKPAADQSQQQ